MQSLIAAGLGHGQVYHHLSQLSMEYTKDRDALAYEWLKKIIGNALYGDRLAWSWWNMGEKSNREPVEKLVLVIDEVGKNTDLAASLISIVRQLYQDIIVTNEKAKQVLLVLVGSGFDWYIRNDHLPYAGDDQTRNTYSTFGTDPQKTNIIILKGPNLLQKEEINGIPTSAILGGTYSSTLATNTRMLTRGIIPILKNPMFAVPSYNGKSVASDYEDLGSTNALMDYAPRIYIDLGGLSNLKRNPALFDKMLLTQFRLLLWERQLSIKESNPAAVKIMEDLKVVGLDFHHALALGIVTSDIKSTSAALRYLACDGFSAPNYAKDGIDFDSIVQHHLVRLCQAYHSVHVDDDTSKSEQDQSNYWAGQYTLTQTWPPCSYMEDIELCDATITRNEVEELYETRMEQLQERGLPNGYKEDIASIVKLVTKKKRFDLVMRQPGSDWQGANFMILRKKEGKSYTLDLYYSNQYSKLQGKQSNQFKKALQRLGVKLEESKDQNAATTINITPDCGKAGYTYCGTNIFAEKLSEKLGATVEIGNRTVIFPKGWEGEPAGSEFLHQAMKKGLMIWTREMLEPTISAFKSSK